MTTDSIFAVVIQTQIEEYTVISWIQLLLDTRQILDESTYRGSSGHLKYWVIRFINLTFNLVIHFQSSMSIN